MKNLLKIAAIALAITSFAACEGNTTVKQTDSVKKDTTIVGDSTHKDTTTVTTTVKKDSVKN
ncbi:hypothetical protein HK413_00255 [Mucilaginibacter sp. S1162]|uniref:Entericidin n=1 Tax=Mucilaginibacter humi TaxID=2732510 RepID=A0ABX1W1Y9_9SPHI|nr:hypothetical protein [Mucilaginibacter humi]NNU33020.1 hypothetical protein [Mucilaginibacter humi]